MESYSFLENSLNDLLNAIAFARLKMLHSSIITPKDLINALQEISQTLRKNNLPLPTYSSSVTQYIDIIGLEAYQTDTRIVFILKIPLVEPETYTLYHLYTTPIFDNRTEFHHVIPTHQKYIAQNDDSMLYISLSNMKNCKPLAIHQKICSDVLPYPIDSEAICEAQLLKGPSHLPKTCQVSLLLAQGYNVKEIDLNLWLITVSNPLPITIKCEGKEVKTIIIQINSLLKLQPYCNGFVGVTRIQAKRIIDRDQNVTYKNHQVMVPYKCCQNIPEKIKIPDLKPIKLNNLDIEDLNIAQHQLDQYSEELEKIMRKPFIEKHQSWFIISLMTLISVLIGLYVLIKCRRRRRLLPSISMGPTDDDFPSPSRPHPKVSTRLKLSRILARRRPSIHPEDDEEDNEETPL
ncbi:uncharacterized protein LOC126748980 [Anthonomus grandis grandis]|uniref:uncharacterized protein LOC126748980 n=1 Tax=Anthonomus grandis grandis TaxID=2921223 RepID=UPI0021662626|nr:uncharacterized protein LOC126748980 [Anthonomus grandis grandis]